LKIWKFGKDHHDYVWRCISIFVPLMIMDFVTRFDALPYQYQAILQKVWSGILTKNLQDFYNIQWAPAVN